MSSLDLKPGQFSSYPPEARKLAVENLAVFERLPVSFLPSLLREVIEYDYKFPAERKALEKEVANLRSLSPAQTQEWFRDFAQIRLSSDLEKIDWISAPAQFVEQLSAYLWTTHQLDAFRTAAIAYGDRLRQAAPEQPPLVPRVGIAMIGRGVSSYSEPLFQKLRPHGAYFHQVRAENGLQTLLDFVAARTKAHPDPYAHWYIDGDQTTECDATLTRLSYAALAPARSALLRHVRAETAKPGMGPEALRTLMARMRPADLSLPSSGDVILDRFELKLLTEGSGTQIFSTTFVQWAAREALRRAQPLTILVCFAPRQRQRPMNELLSGALEHVELDPVGSLIDADMGAYYNWLNQQRLPGAEQSSFLVWFENHGDALAIGPSMPRGTHSTNPTDLRELLSWMT